MIYDATKTITHNYARTPMLASNINKISNIIATTHQLTQMHNANTKDFIKNTNWEPKKYKKYDTENDIITLKSENIVHSLTLKIYFASLTRINFEKWF